MIGLLVLQIVTVLTRGVEPRQQSLEDMKPSIDTEIHDGTAGVARRGLA